MTFICGRDWFAGITRDGRVIHTVPLGQGKRFIAYCGAKLDYIFQDEAEMATCSPDMHGCLRCERLIEG